MIPDVPTEAKMTHCGSCAKAITERDQLRAHLAQRTTALRKVAAHLEACGDCNTCLLDEQPDLHAELVPPCNCDRCRALADLPDAPKH